MDSARVLEMYRRKGLAHPVGFGRRPALVVVDMTKGFTDPESPLGSRLDPVIGQLERILVAFREKALPVFFTTVIYEEPECTDGGWFVVKAPALKILRPGSLWVEVDRRLAPRPEEPVLVKKYVSAFFGTDLADRLTRLGVDTVVVTGATTSGCVRGTVVDALQYGYRVIVPEDAVGDRSEEAHAANLLDIQGKYGDVIGTDELLAALRP